MSEHPEQREWSDRKRKTWQQYLTYTGVETYFRAKASRARNPERITKHLQTADDAKALAEQVLKEHQQS